MKKAAIIIMAVALASCGKEFLNVEPHNFTDAVFWKTSEQAESALAGVYSPFQDEECLGGEEWCGMEAFSDNGYMNDNYADFIAMSEFRATQNTEGDLSMNSFRSYYKVIKRANDVLNNVPGMTVLGDAQKNRILGEANFLLGFAYWQLVRRYGGLPIYDQSNPSSALVRNTEEETWAELEKRVKASTTLLTWDHEIGRPGLGAAYGLLAKVYAYLGRWEEAKTAAETVITSGRHHLLGSYAGLFRVENEGNSELLWELGARFGEYPITPILMLPNNVWNGTHPEPSGVGWRLVSATVALYNSYQAGDLRKAVTVAKRGVDMIRYNGYTDILQAPNNQSDIVCIKYNAPYEEGYTDWAAGLDVPALRLADILLIDAEAIMMLNGGGPANRTTAVAAAASPLNEVRERAGLPAIPNPTFNDLMYERRMELAFEGGERHFDLVRWGLAKEVYDNLPAEGVYKPKRTFITETHRLLPYPQQEINNSGGSIKQNPGY